MDVCQAFLHQPKYGEFYLRRKPSEVVGNTQLDTKGAALCQAVYVPAKCRRQSHFIQHWWVQKIRGRAYLLAQILNQFPGIFDALKLLRWVALRFIFESRKDHCQCSQTLSALSCSSRAMRRRSSSWACISLPERSRSWSAC